jgi:hypothetical protein
VNDLKDIWKKQETEYAPMALEDIRMQAGKLHSRVYWRNMREIMAAVVVIAAFGAYLFVFPDPLMRTGSGLIILGTLYVIWQFQTRSRTDALPGDTSSAAWTDYYKSELLRQRDALKSVWKWYLAPLVPGFAIFLLGMVHSMPHATWKIAGVAALAVVVFAGVGLLNRYGAGRLQKKIDRLGY